jgi:hypothetical protein
MIATRAGKRPPDDRVRLHSDDVRRLITTDYTRQQVAGAVHESFVQALHVRFGELAPDERAWVREWLMSAVPRLTERTVNAMATQLEAGLSAAPGGLVDCLDERRQRAVLGIE